MIETTTAAGTARIGTYRKVEPVVTKRKPIPHPENIATGERWFVWYSDHASTSKCLGSYRGIDVKYGVLWASFLVDGEHEARIIPWKSIYDMERE